MENIAVPLSFLKRSCMKIVIAGGGGFIGRGIVEKFARESHAVVVLTRSHPRLSFARENVRTVLWDARTVGTWASEVDGADAVMNFAGEPLDAKRWTQKQKEIIVRSRVESTEAIVEALRRATNKPSVFINASAVGYYGSVEQEEVTEEYRRGEGFLADVVHRWEETALRAVAEGVRTVLLRMGVVLARDGGALTKMALPFRLFVGGPIGLGRQWFPWIHRDDVASIAHFAMKNSALAGPVNAVAPESVTMRQFCETLGKVLRRPSWAPVPGFVLKLALGEMSEMILTGQRVVPANLLRVGYSFIFPTLDDALRDIFL